jgi:NADH:ubiquinone oxidoreductase subunit 3 (subunit A)
MLYNYIALLFFSGLGLLIPLLFLLAAKLLGRASPGNPAKGAPYESAEETIGSNRAVYGDYLPYFMLFLPFEIVLVVLILWSTVARGVDRGTSAGIMLLAVISMVLSVVGYKFIGGGAGKRGAVYK